MGVDVCLPRRPFNQGKMQLGLKWESQDKTNRNMQLTKKDIPAR
jgi:hypothetical protein